MLLAGLPHLAHAPTPAGRRAMLSAASDGALVDALVAMAHALRQAHRLHAPLARAASLPLAEVVASPFGLRAVALGVEVGSSARHRELRLGLEWPDELVGAEEIRDPDHGVWDRGILKTGKYQGFMADEPFASYDPSHVSKWGPHELMHRAAGFFYRPGATRWETYLGARLNELVPVVLFYGPEQVMRLDEGAFEREASGRHPSARLEDARWLVEDDGALEARAARTIAQLRAGLAHFESELKAIDEELRTGRRVRASHPFLDASSDATAYVVGHHARLASPAVTAVLARVGADARADDVALYRDRVEALFDRLLFASLSIDLEASGERSDRREVWDLLLRAAHLGEGMEDELEEMLDDAAEVLAGAGRPDLSAWRARIALALGDEAAEAVLRNGSVDGHALAQLADGVSQVAPCAWGLLDDHRRGEEGALARLAASDALWDRAPLAERVGSWLREEGVDAAVSDVARFEAAIVGARRDDGVERLCVPIDALPDALDEGELVRSEGFARMDLEHEVLTVHAAFADGEELAWPARGPTTLLVGAFFDGVSVLPLPGAVAAAWDALEDAARPARSILRAIDAALTEAELPEGWPQDGEGWVRELLVAGALGWRPLRAR